MKKKNFADNREAEARAALRAEFSEYLKANGLVKNENNAHLFAFGKTLDSNSRVNLVAMLMSCVV